MVKGPGTSPNRTTPFCDWYPTEASHPSIRLTLNLGGGQAVCASFGRGLITQEDSVRVVPRYVIHCRLRWLAGLG